MAKKANIAESVRAAAEPVANEMGLALWDVVFVKEGPTFVLRLVIDREGGVDMDCCEAFSRAIDPLIDELDPTESEYCLEVSSPGLGRELRTDAHLAAFVGKEVAVKLFKKNEAGIKEAEGVLQSFDSASLTLALAGGPAVFDRSAVAHVKANDDKDLFGGK